MTDKKRWLSDERSLVEYLRDSGYEDDLCEDAADEIERLTRQLAEAKAESEGRRIKLGVCSIERTAEWTRAGQAEARIKKLEAVLAERDARMAVLMNLYREWPKTIRCQNDHADWEVAIEAALSRAPEQAKKLLAVVEAAKKGHWSELADWLDLKFPNDADLEIQRDLRALGEAVRDLKSDGLALEDK